MRLLLPWLLTAGLSLTKGQREDGDAVIVESADPAASTRFLSSGNPALDGAVVGLGVGVLGSLLVGKLLEKKPCRVARGAPSARFLPGIESGHQCPPANHHTHQPGHTAYQPSNTYQSSSNYQPAHTYPPSNNYKPPNNYHPANNYQNDNHQPGNSYRPSNSYQPANNYQNDNYQPSTTYQASNGHHPVNSYIPANNYQQTNSYQPAHGYQGGSSYRPGSSQQGSSYQRPGDSYQRPGDSYQRPGDSYQTPGSYQEGRGRGFPQTGAHTARPFLGVLAPARGQDSLMKSFQSGAPPRFGK